MNTNREIISEVEQMAVNAIVNQPDERKAAERHFSATAKKIVAKALQAVDIMEIGEVCRRAVTGAAIQDYDLLAKLLTDPDFDHYRLAKAIEAQASVKPVDYPPAYFTPGWLAELAKKMAANGGAGRAGNVPGASRPGMDTLPPGADGTEAASRPVGGKCVDRDYVSIVAKTPQTVVFQVTLGTGRRISAELEAESTSHAAQAFLYDGGNCVCQITFFNQYQGRSWTYPIVRRALNGLMSKCGKRSRYNANRKAESGDVD